MTNGRNEEEKQLPDLEQGNRLSTKLNRLSEIARQNPTLRFTSLAQLLDKECLRESYRKLNTRAADGIDRVTYKEYGQDLEEIIS